MKTKWLAAASAVAAIGALGASAPSCLLPAAPGQGTVHLPGGTPYATIVENDVHGRLVNFGADYPDGYIHRTLIPSGVTVRDLEHYTCVNPEVPNRPPCAASPEGNDAIPSTDPEDLGHLGQPLTGMNHGADITFHAAGSGSTLQWRTYEHGPHEAFYLIFADGFHLNVVVDHPIHYDDLHLVTQPTVSGAVSHAFQTPTDEDS